MVALSYFTEETDLVKQHVSERDRKVKSTAADSAFPSVKDGGGWGGVGWVPHRPRMSLMTPVLLCSCISHSAATL